MMKNLFKLSDACEIEISDGWIRFNHSGGSTDFQYRNNFYLNAFGCAIQSITPPKKNKWVTLLNTKLSVALECGGSEDHAVLCIANDLVYLSLGTKILLLPKLAEFFIANHKC